MARCGQSFVGRCIVFESKAQAIRLKLLATCLQPAELRARLPTFVALTTVALAVGVLVALLSSQLVDSPSGGIIGGVLLVIVTGAPTACRLLRDGTDAPGAYALASILFLGLTSLVWLGTPIGAGPGLTQGDIATALHLVALGLVAFGLGTRAVGAARRRPMQDYYAGMMPSRTALIVCFVISVVSVSVAVALGNFSYLATPEAAARVASYGEVISVLVTLGNLVVIATALAYFGGRDSRLLRLLVLFIIAQMLIGFVGGTKGFTVLPLLFAVGAYVLTRRRLPVTPTLLAIVFTLVLVVPTNLRYREAVRSESQAPRYALGQALSTPLDLDPFAAPREAFDFVSTRFRLIDYVALVETQTPSPFTYAGGDNYVLLPLITTVPRAVWSGKPSLDDAGQFTHTYGQVPYTVRSSTPITQMGDLYRNFGPLGVGVGMFLWGILLGAATAAYHRWRSPRADLVYIFTILTVVIYVELDLPALVATASKTVPFSMLVAWLILPGRSSPPGYAWLLGRRHLREPSLATLGEPRNLARAADSRSARLW